jgi:hypothetical protein
MAVSLLAQALCSLDDVKLHLASYNSGANDDLLARLINSFTAASEKHCHRSWLYGQRTEYFDSGFPGSTGGVTSRLFVTAPPIASSPAITVNDDPQGHTFASITQLVQNTDYVVNYNNGMIEKMTPLWYDVGFTQSPRRSTFRRELRIYGFQPGIQSIQVVYTGGLVTPRSDAPALPTLSTSGSGLTGAYLYRISTITGSDPNTETVATVPGNITLTNQGGHLVFANPGTGFSTNIYRSKDQGASGTVNPICYFVASVAGDSGGNQSYTDTTLDTSLTTAITAPNEGPITVPDELREACATQVVDWFMRRDKPGEIGMTQTGQGGVTFIRKQGPYLQIVDEILKQYRRGTMLSVP